MSEPEPSQHEVPAPLLASELSGRLPCVRCQYDLQGVSVLGVCPECGTPVRTTILAVVDPLADELQPIRAPRLTALGLCLWVMAALAAALLMWALLLPAVLALWIDRPPAPVSPILPSVITALLGLSAIGSVALWRPQPALDRSTKLSSFFATVTFAPLIFTVHDLLTRTRELKVRSIAEAWPRSAIEAVERPLAVLFLLMIILLARPVLRLLVARSLAIRTGRVDRQTVVAMAAALLTVLLGELLGRLATLDPASALGDFLFHLGFVMIVGGLALFTLGLLGASIDALRVAQAILTPAPSLNQVLGTDPSSTLANTKDHSA